MYRPLNELEKQHLQLSLRDRNLPQVAITSLISMVDVNARSTHRSAFDVYSEIESARRSAMSSMPNVSNVPPFERAVMFLGDGARITQPDVQLHPYDALYGDVALTSQLNRFRMRFFNSPTFRQQWLSDRDLPTNLSDEDTKIAIFHFSQSR